MIGGTVTKIGWEAHTHTLRVYSCKLYRVWRLVPRDFLCHHTLQTSFFLADSSQKNLHAILLEELEAESKHWICTPEDIAAKITEDIWEVPGNDSAGGQITMPDEHLWRFSADVGLYNQVEEVCS